MNVFDEFQWRGMIYDSTEDLREVFASQQVSAYIGFDPSAASLHVGSLLPVMALVRLQKNGHTPIAIVGGGTGLIGDPSGKSQERPLLTKEQLEINVQGIKAQLSRFLDFENKVNPAKLINNADWLAQQSMLDFLRDVGKYFTVNYMLAKDAVDRRLGQAGGISFTEFSYLLLQAYDFLVLYDRHHCILQMGGSDQWGNITAGIELIRRLRGGKAYGLVFPLMTTSAGTKFGKTEAGTIWLDPNLTSPFRFYQFWVNTDDRDVIQYLKFFTMLSQEEIEGLEASMKSAPEKREAQRRLAREVTRMVHGETALEKAERSSEALFGKELSGLAADDILDIFADVPSSEMNKSQFEAAGLALVDLVVASGLAASKGEARRLIQAGGIYLNNRRVDGEQQTVPLSESIEGQFLVLRKGQKEYRLIRLRE